MLKPFTANSLFILFFFHWAQIISTQNHLIRNTTNYKTRSWTVLHLASLSTLSKEKRKAKWSSSNTLACNELGCRGEREREGEASRWINHCGIVQSWPRLTPGCLHTRAVWTSEGSGTQSHKSTKTRSVKQIRSCSLFNADLAHNQRIDSQSSCVLTHL